MRCWPVNKSIGNWLPLALALVLFGCARQPESGRLLATAGSAKLYLNEVSSHADTSSAYAVRNYVSNWVNEQLLYDEAKKLGIDNSPGFQKRVDEFSRQLAITMLLNHRVYDAPVSLGPGEVQGFYNSHRDEFRAADEIAFVNLAAFDKRSIAVKFRNALVSGSSWTETLGDIPTYAILDIKDSVYLKVSGTNPAIWNVVQSINVGSVSFPIQIDSLSYVVEVINKIGAGEPLPLSYAAPLIRERLTIEKRRKLYEALMDSLRAVGNFQIDPSVAIRDTSVQE
ncbi:MAG: peptidylprolyl isomerase [Bacteroidetes bacterium]|nr:peptidylprolyl isomerase [Bacteroidota bacterium]